MNKILRAQALARDIKLFEVEAPLIAKKRKPGQFVILRIRQGGERIPITIADSFEDSIKLIVRNAGRTTMEMMSLKEGDSILDLAGPLGRPTEIKNFGSVVILGGGVGTALAFPVIKALKESGNYLVSVIGAKSKDSLILTDEIKMLSDEIFISTDDGSRGMKGDTAKLLEELLHMGRNFSRAYAFGPIPMMSAVSRITLPYGLKTIVSLNPIMVDGTGMCGGCRATVGGKRVFVCVDGPEFDGHQVDFNELQRRNSVYRSQEKESMDHQCKLTSAEEKQ